MVKRVSILACLIVSATVLAQYGYVYATKSGSKYHLLECKVLNRSKTVLKMTVSQAKDLKLKACSICKPPAW